MDRFFGIIVMNFDNLKITNKVTYVLSTCIFSSIILTVIPLRIAVPEQNQIQLYFQHIQILREKNRCQLFCYFMWLMGLYLEVLLLNKKALRSFIIAYLTEI
jgi:hypothetical protein